MGLPGLKGLAYGIVCAFFLSFALKASAEDRTISIFNIHTKDTITVTFKKNGSYVPEALKQLNHFMRDWRRDQETHMDPALIDLIWELHQELGSKEPVHLVCGYRSSETNENLRRTVGGQAKHSRHITGQAADLIFPDVPLKQLRYSALIRERGGVGYYPASGLPFVHVDTGNVRHWPRLPRLELALLFPKGHSQHVPADGRPITRDDARTAQAKWHTAGYEMPWALTHKTARTMLASLTPSDAPAKMQMASLVPTFGSASPAPSQSAGPRIKPESFASKPESLAREPETHEVQLSEEGEEQEDVIVFEPLPATFLLAEKPLTYSDVPDPVARPAVFQKISLLMSPPSIMASEEFERRLQIEDLYEANKFKGPAIIAFIWHKARMMAAASSAATTR